MTIYKQDVGAKSVNIVREAEVLSPTAQTTTNNYADLSGSLIDTLYKMTVSFITKNTGGSNGAYWKVVGSNDGTNFVDANTEATLAAGVSAGYSTSFPVYRYYKIQIKAQSGGSQTTVSTVAMAKS